jgi:hypothetical protein
VFENRVLRRIFGTKRDEVTGEWRKLHNGGFIICTRHQILLGRSNQGERGGRVMWHAWKRGGKHWVSVRKPEGKGPFGRRTRRWARKEKTAVRNHFKIYFKVLSSK